MSNKETDNEYSKVIAELSPTYRVIQCKDNIQAILQRKTKDGWKGISYFRTKAGLIFNLLSKGFGKEEAQKLLSDMPERI